jgi:glycosyltransferase involved in cell wall biosynthesis
MLVSIIITSYNYEAFLREAIDSALNQSHTETEVIVVDDGSTDGSAAIIKSYGEHITPIFKQNGGQHSCVNAGFENCRGEVIIFLDADDVLLKDAVALHVTSFSHANTVKSCGYMNVIDEGGLPTGQRIPRHLPESGNYRDRTLAKGLDVFRTSFTSGQAWSHDFLQRALPLPDSHNKFVGVDGYLTSIDRLFGRIGFIHHPVVNYRHHARNMGPIRFQFDSTHMNRRIKAKQLRIRFAESWITRLGYDVDLKEFRKVRDWRLTLMSHALHLLERDEPAVPLMEFVGVPFASLHIQRWKATAISVCLLTIRLLPHRYALQATRYLLERTQFPGSLLSRRIVA